ncbi:MAG TPA: DUF427 domain-containing protein, partial [Acidimicrobiales bacterium]|nr:DUF427 domain-containing protein [Acidimicrobiales bacterium]
MSLTTGKGPLSATPAGRFTVPMPDNISYIEPFRRRVRATKDGRTVIDCERALLLHRPGRPPTFAFPKDDVTGLPVVDEPDAPRYVTVPWDAADAWFEEDEQIFGHPRNPYHRVDCLRSHRPLRVEAAGTTLVDTTDTMVVYETALDPRLYVDRNAVRTELTRSQLETYCPYKGTATYWHAIVDGTALSDVAWSYEDALPESTPLEHLVSFDEQRVSVV